MHSHYKEYKKSKLENATDLEALVLLYDEIVIVLTRAKENFTANKEDPAYKENIEAARVIVRGLTLILDFEKGGEIAKNLCSLYNYMDKRLLVAKEGIMATCRYCDEVISMVSKLRESWDKLAQDEKKEVEAKNRASSPSLPTGNLEISI